jgi:hypothetical protein
MDKGEEEERMDVESRGDGARKGRVDKGKVKGWRVGRGVVTCRESADMRT